MDIFLKTAAGILTALILWISLSKNGRDIAVLISLAVCAMALIAAMSFFQPIVEFLRKIQTLGNLDNDLLSVILKVVGIGMVGEFCTLICKDAGNEAMGKALHFLSTTVILWMSIPVLEKLLSLLQRILGTV